MAMCFLKLCLYLLINQRKQMLFVIRFVQCFAVILPLQLLNHVLGHIVKTQETISTDTDCANTSYTHHTFIV